MAYGSYVDDILLHHPIGTVEVAKQYRASFHHLLSANIGRRGLDPQSQTDYGLLRQLQSQPIMVTGRKRATDVVEPADGTVAQGRVYLKQLTGAVGWDFEALENASGDRQILDIVTGEWDRFIKGFLGVLNAIDYGDGTGRLARVSASTDNTSYFTVTVDNTAQDFGWSKLALVEDGMVVDIYTVPDIVGTTDWTVKVIRGEVYGVNKTAGTFNVRAITGVTNTSLTANAADGDFVFLSGAVTLASTTKWVSWDLPMGLKGIIDDGGAAGNEFDDGTGWFNGSYYGATWQSLNRSTAANALFRALIRRPTEWYSSSVTNENLRPANLEKLFEVFDQLFASGSTPDPNALLVICSPPTYRWLEARVVAAQNGMQDISDGHVLAGLMFDGFKVTAGRSTVVVPVKQDLAVPDGTFLIADMGRIGIWEKMPLQGITPEGSGGTQFAVPGSRKLRLERWGRTRYNIFTPNCMTSAELNGVDITA